MKFIRLGLLMLMIGQPSFASPPLPGFRNLGNRAVRVISGAISDTVNTYYGHSKRADHRQANHPFVGLPQVQNLGERRGPNLARHSSLPAAFSTMGLSQFPGPAEREAYGHSSEGTKVTAGPRGVLVKFHEVTQGVSSPSPAPVDSLVGSLTVEQRWAAPWVYGSEPILQSPTKPCFKPRVRDSSGFVAAGLHAWANQGSWELDPNQVWFAILDVVSRVMYLDEGFKKRLLKGYESIELGVSSENPDPKELLEQLSMQLPRLFKEREVAQVISPRFSTSTDLDNLAFLGLVVGSDSRGTLVWHFMDSTEVEKADGISSVLLRGTARDWELLRDHFLKLAEHLSSPEYQFEPWIDRLKPVLNQFIATFNGNVDRTFWQSMVTGWEDSYLYSPGSFEGWLTLFASSSDRTTDGSPERLVVNQLVSSVFTLPFSAITKTGGGVAKSRKDYIWVGGQTGVTLGGQPGMTEVEQAVEAKNQAVTPNYEWGLLAVPERGVSWLLEKCNDGSCLGSDGRLNHQTLRELILFTVFSAKYFNMDPSRALIVKELICKFLSRLEGPLSLDVFYHFIHDHFRNTQFFDLEERDKVVREYWKFRKRHPDFEEAARELDQIVDMTLKLVPMS